MDPYAARPFQVTPSSTYFSTLDDDLNTLFPILEWNLVTSAPNSLGSAYQECPNSKHPPSGTTLDLEEGCDNDPQSIGRSLDDETEFNSWLRQSLLSTQQSLLPLEIHQNSSKPADFKKVDSSQVCPICKKRLQTPGLSTLKRHQTSMYCLEKQAEILASSTFAQPHVDLHPGEKPYVEYTLPSL
jgi:hypothetical protein